MKLRRFTALTTQKAFLKVSEKMGPDALIYSTRRIPHGVEVIAGLASLEKSKSSAGDTIDLQQNLTVDTESIDKLTIQLQVMEESLKGLSDHIIHLHSRLENDKKNQWWNLIKKSFRFKKSANVENLLIGTNQ